MITLKEACSLLQIHRETGKNWVRTGKMQPSYKEGAEYYFSEDTIQNLLREIREGEKLLQRRRNKSAVKGRVIASDYIRTDSPNQQKVTQKIREALRSDHPETVLKQLMIKIQSELTGEQKEYSFVRTEDLLGLVYISGCRMESRKKSGVYYTPYDLVKRMIDERENQLRRPGVTILDPCCGTGNFLLQLPEYIRPEQIYGLDIDSEAVDLARFSLRLRYPDTSEEFWRSHIRCVDYLSDPIEERFDLIMGNPPWGPETDPDRMKYERTHFAAVSGSRPELADLFVERSLSMLRIGGYISFVLPEALLTVEAHENLRRLLVEQTSIRHLVYAGDVFHGVQCPCILLTAEYTGKPMQVPGMEVETEHRSFTIGTPRAVSALRFSFTSDDGEYEILHRMEAGGERFYLKDRTEFALGIVTGDNRKYLSADPQGGEPILRGKDIHPFFIDEPSDYVIYDPKRFQQCADESIYRCDEKLLYRFIGKRPVTALDTDRRLPLNSCNVMIPRIPGIPNAYVMAVLNSSAAGFWWEKQYRTMKILRRQLEEFPFPVPTQRELDEIVYKIEHTDRESIIEVLDPVIDRLYGIDRRRKDE